MESLYHVARDKNEKKSYPETSFQLPDPLDRNNSDLNFLADQLEKRWFENPLGIFPFVGRLLSFREQFGVGTPRLLAPDAQFSGLPGTFPCLNAYLVAF